MPLTIYRRGKIWHYRGTVAGRRLRGSCETADKATAQRAAAEIEARQWKGHFDGPGAVLTFAQAAMKYRAAGKADRFLKPVEDYFKNTLVKDITSGTVLDMALELYPNYTPLSRNRAALVPAQAVINHAAELGLCAPIRIKRFRGRGKSKDPATLEWVKAFQAHATSPHLGAMCLFMYLTGARPGEACKLKWDDINLQRREAKIATTKGGDPDVANLPVPLVVALSNLDRVPNRPVFWYRNNRAVERAWNVTIKLAGIKKLSPHCCRHGFATDLLRKGVDVVTVAKLGRWKSAAQVLATYGHAQNNPRLTDLLIDTSATQDTAENARNPRIAATS
jgi:integrase